MVVPIKDGVLPPIHAVGDEVGNPCSSSKTGPSAGPATVWHCIFSTASGPPQDPGHNRNTPRSPGP